MYLSKLSLYNFRKYKQILEDGKIKPGLIVNLKPGLNVLIGENESGKTTIVDAIRYILQTQSNDYTKIEELDFYYNEESEERERTLKIECEFSGFNDEEAGNFLEWIGFDDNNDYILKVWLIAEIREGKIIQEVRAGMDDVGIQLDGGARELLKITYLKPLRDAEFEMTSGRRSRFAQLLKNHNLFKVSKADEDNHPVKKIVKEADTKIRHYFGSEPINSGEQEVPQHGKVILDGIKDLIDEFTIEGSDKNPFVSLSGVELWEILHRLTLNIDKNQPSLGLMNLLYIAAELMLLKREGYNGLKLVIIEELEAHLHPHYQLNTLKYFIQNSASTGQVILTTHSVIIGSSVKIDNLIICKENNVFPMGKDTKGNSYTELDDDDTKFLERFLDATKANLFFARGVIIVEGDSENLLVPAISEVIGLPLHKYGVSIINVGSKAWVRYAKVFERKNPPQLPIKISIINDGDIPCKEHIIATKPKIYYRKIDNEYIIETDKYKFISLLKVKNIPESKIKKRKINPKDNNLIDSYIKFLKGKSDSLYKYKKSDNFIKICSNEWTLEYSIAGSGLKEELLKSMNKAKELSSFGVCLPENSDDQYSMMEPFLKGLSKALTAQFLSEIILSDKEKYKDIINKDKQLNYIVEAIKHACGCDIGRENAAIEQ
ncbi:MAG: ATP-dependent endonuclease [Candidatus Cloacimonadaceae bacterium]